MGCPYSEGMAVFAGAQSTGLNGLSRRHFIAGVSSAAAAAYVLGPNGAGAGSLDPAGALGDLVDGAKRLLSIGYVEGSAEKGLASLEGGARVLPAGSLRRGDASLRGRSADVGVHGLTPGHDPAAMPSVHVDAMFSSTGVGGGSGKVVPFYAWTLSSSPAAFSVLLERAPRLGFTVTAGGAAASGAFTTGKHDGMAPLHEGVYLLGLAPGVWDRPRTLPALEDASSWAGLVSALVTVQSPVAADTSDPADAAA